MKMCLLHVWKSNLYIKVNQLRYGSFHKSIKVHQAYFPPSIVLVVPLLESLEMHVQKANYQAFTSVSECAKP